MFMRYEWGLAVGHEYTHRDATKANQTILAYTNRIEQVESVPRSTITVTSPPQSSASNGEPSSTEAINQGSNSQEPGALRVVGDPCVERGEGEEGIEDGWESDTESLDRDDQDFFSDPERDSEEEREAVLFGDCYE